MPGNIFRSTPPTAWERFRRDPPLFIARWLYTHQPPISAPTIKGSQPVKVVCISDTHNEHPRLPNGDILVHAGDITVNGTFAELQAQLDWLNTLPHPHKIVVAGNHDILLDQSYYKRYPNRRLAGPENDETKLKQLNWGSITYLNQSLVTLDIRGQTIRVYGSPMTPECGNFAYQYLRIKDTWANTIPPSTDILVTHTPAQGHVDDGGKGCPHLNREMWRVKPRLHVCGHIHMARGKEYADWSLLQLGYDTICRGKAGPFTRLLMLVNWVWMWMLYAVFGARRHQTTFVNAAVVGDWGLAEGDKTMVVEV